MPNNSTERLFYDDEYDSIAAAIGASGKPFKMVAAHLFPDMKPESAYARLKQCQSSTGDQRLTFGQVVRLMQFCEAYDPLAYACDSTFHARPHRVAPADEAVRLVESINSATQTIERAMKQLEVLKRTSADLRRVA